ncbi:MAG: putative Ig domain-containing protein [Thermoplasmatota archaeon]
MFAGMGPASTEAVSNFQTRGKGAERIPVSDAGFTFDGEAIGDRVGSSISISGDYNGDGISDILISAPYNSSNDYRSGKVYLIYGSGDLSNIEGNFSLENASASFHGEFMYDRLGNGQGALSCAGDVNGDGIDDFLVSSWYFDSSRGKTYLFFGRKEGFGKYMNVSTCNASFLGEFPGDWSGYPASRAGDVNGDGYDDILISAYRSSRGGISYQGAVYLIFGKPDGWGKNLSLSKADVIIAGSTVNSYLGYGNSAGDFNDDGLGDFVISQYNPESSCLVFGHTGKWESKLDPNDADVMISTHPGSGLGVSAGDLNDDGFDDLLIGLPGFSSGGIQERGKVLIYFGNRTSGGYSINETHANASYLGYYYRSKLGGSMGGIGDIDQDGFDDVLIGGSNSFYEGLRNVGVSYLINGKKNGWGKDLNVSIGNDCIIGEFRDHYAGSLSDGPGDVDNDGNPDIMIGASRANTSIGKTGCVYLFKQFNPNGPTSIQSVNLFSDEACTEEISQARMYDSVYIELRGTDGNSTTQNNAYAIVTSMDSSFQIKLQEIGINTGVYRGSFTISDTTSAEARTIRSGLGDRVRVFSVKNVTKFAYVDIVTSVKLYPPTFRTTALEDEEYRIGFSNSGISIIQTWDVEIDSDWLSWNDVDKELYGYPDHTHAGSRFVVSINISDAEGNFDSNEFLVFVENAPPIITTESLGTAVEDELYEVDYNSDDDDLADMSWSLDTNASWLSIDAGTGVLYGTPVNEDVGTYSVTVTADDGKEGISKEIFNLTVINVNDPPKIKTEPISSVIEDEEYFLELDVADVDDDNGFMWDVDTEADWLLMNQTAGVLFGTPVNDDVGSYRVNVSVEDEGGLSDSIEFILEVINSNDGPEWMDQPEDIIVNQGEWYHFTVKAYDIDIGDTITYGLESDPFTNITINETSGEIGWYAYLPESPYELDVEVTATDGTINIFSFFTITVIPNLKPTVNLLSPADGKTVIRSDLLLEWEGCDSEGCDLIYDLYLSDNAEDVISLAENCMITKGCSDSSYIPQQLKYGSTYYWSVIPHDDVCAGSCLDGVFSFFVNTPPMIGPIPNMEIPAGESFTFSIPGGDNDTGQESDLTYSLVDGPDGLDLFPDTGKIAWIPSEDQTGPHEITVTVYDGCEYTKGTFNIEVIGSSSSSRRSIAAPIIIAVSAVMILIILGIIIALIISRKREEDESAEDSPLEIRDEEEDEEDHVATTMDEAYGHIGPHALPTHQELYGQREIDFDEEVTRDDLRESLSEQIRQLEEMKEGAGITGANEPIENGEE